jgi:hypothetical protein
MSDVHIGLVRDAVRRLEVVVDELARAPRTEQRVDGLRQLRGVGVQRGSLLMSVA